MYIQMRRYAHIVQISAMAPRNGVRNLVVDIFLILHLIHEVVDTIRITVHVNR